MPGTKSSIKPLAADIPDSASDQISQLELNLQRQLEEDIARIFDESIYSDLEVVCGRLKILTHSCILKARTYDFYHKLETILHVDIGRNTFDEIYSFISDAYTECNIQHQEKEIINYLNDNLNLRKCGTETTNSKNKLKDLGEVEVFATPSANSPAESSLHKTLNSSPSTELTKEYYALVPIEKNILDKELKEQDALSSAFQSFIKSQDSNEIKIKQCVKPTSLVLKSSHISKINKPSISCDISKEVDSTKLDNLYSIKVNNSASQVLKNNQEFETEKTTDCVLKNNICDKTEEFTYSPDSLVTDEPSSSSDYLSAAYTVSPGIGSSGCFSQLNVGDKKVNKMENIFTLSDSGLENTGLESFNSHKDVTLTDLSLTESTLHDMLSDEGVNNYDSMSSPSEVKQFQNLKICTSQHSLSGPTTSDKEQKDRKSNKATSLTDGSGTSSKEEKQRQNEEIVILESSSLSSETGSWESVFPPKMSDNDICQKFITSERLNSTEAISSSAENKTTNITSITDQLCPSLVQKSPFKSTSCFIDAASLADDGDDTLAVNTESKEFLINTASETIPSTSSRPTCVNLDFSSDESSIGNDNEDSLERLDNKDPDSIQKDGSPTIFEMTPITEDSLCTNVCVEDDNTAKKYSTPFDDQTQTCVDKNFRHQAVIIETNTPNNSIVTLRPSEFTDAKDNGILEPRLDCSVEQFIQPRDKIFKDFKLNKHTADSPIISGGASVEDHLPQLSSHSGSPKIKRIIENIPIVSGARIPEEISVEKPVKCASSAAAWVVDMSQTNSVLTTCTNPDVKQNKSGLKKKTDFKETVRTSSAGDNNKGRSSVDSDSSEKSAHKFYIDLSSLPDATPPQEPNREDSNSEKKNNIFSMFIGLGEKTVVKEMPARLSSSLSKKNLKSSTPGKSRKSSSSVKTQDDNFELLESLCNDPSISISQIVEQKKTLIETSEMNIAINESVFEYPTSLPVADAVKLSPKAAIEEEPDLFVKLSDLDKPVQPSEPVELQEETSTFKRMSRSIPDNNWAESSLGSHSVDIISSFHSENALSLNRLFPHLKNDFSKSMPGSLSGKTKSPFKLGVSSSQGDIDKQECNNTSEMSSVQSSTTTCRSVAGTSTTEDGSRASSLLSNCQSRLGQDLLRMFLEEIAPDVIIEVSGRRIRAHKCILSSRCQYFAGILSGGWVESAGNVITLPPFSFNVVHFALCHIYCGESWIPDTINIVELVTIADMLSLDGLKEAIMFKLKAKYCHYFHQPCSVCTVGVLECFPLSSVYGLDELYRKCLRWVTKYFYKVWPTKAFAILPSDLLHKCYQEHIVNMTAENIIDTVYGCEIVAASLDRHNWQEKVKCMCQRLMDAADRFVETQLVAVLQALANSNREPPHSAMKAIDYRISDAIPRVSLDEVCRAYAVLSDRTKALRTQAQDESLLYNYINKWRSQCEKLLARYAPRVLNTQAFKNLCPGLQNNLYELGCDIFGKRLPMPSSSSQGHSQPRRSHSHTKRSDTHDPARSVELEHVRALFVPYAAKPRPHVGSLNMLSYEKTGTKIGKLNLGVPKIRTTKAQEERAKFNQMKTIQPPVKSNVKTTLTRPSYQNAKPRYLEPKVTKEREKGAPAFKKKMVSSTESSRNSSPVLGQKNRSRLAGMSQDSVATSSRPRTADPSTDSLTESQHSNKYATYTKTRHTNKGPIQTIPPPKCKPSQIPNLKKSRVPLQQKPNENGTQQRNKSTDRKVSGSLMNATKSSMAKKVAKVVKEPRKKTVPQEKNHLEEKQQNISEIPVMERSGTFLKDQPTFGETSKNDINK